MNSSYRYQAVVIGGGCAGTILAAILQRIGLATLVVERAAYPRFAVGESLTPFGNQVLRRLGSRYGLDYLVTMSRFGTWRRDHPDVMCGLKRGFSYVCHDRERLLDTSSEHGDELMVAASESDERGDTQWLRADVDKWLASQARAVGVEVWENCQLRSLERRGSQWLLEVQPSSQQALRHVVCDGPLFDASGSAAAVALRQGARMTVSGLVTHTRAVYTHVWEGCRFEDCLSEAGARLGEYPYRFDDSAVHHLVDGGWIWQIRFCDGRVSIGFVKNELDCSACTAQPPHDVFGIAREYPLLRKWVSDVRMADEPGRWLRTSRLQRRLTAAVGDGWICLPHTYAFLDPLHSTGLAWTLAGIERIAERFGNHGLTWQAFAKQYQNALQRDVAHLDAMISLAYLAMPNWDLFRLSTLVYFAAATCQERAEKAEDIVWGMLQAGNPRFRDAVRRIQTAFAASNVHDSRTVSELAALIERELQPFDHVGLFRPTYPNLYANTAAPYQTD